MPTLSTKPSTAPRTALPLARKHVWTAGVRWLGNIIPALLALPPACIGIAMMAIRGQIMGPGLYVFAAAPVVGWVGMNFLGLHRNGAMKAELVGFLKGVRPKLQAPRYFVGIATPTYTSLIDPHEDVGLLILHPDKMEFFGDHLNITLKRHDVTDIRFGANAHTVVGLGRWIVLEGRIGERRIRLQVELRERPTLMGNLLLSGRFKTRLDLWLKEK